MFLRIISIALMSMLSISCASTSLVDSWQNEEVQLSYQKPMIIGISDSQQTRQLYEKHFVASLEEEGIEAVPSYTLIDSKQKINRETVVNAIKGTDIDAVLVTYRIADNADFVHDVSLVNETHEGHDEQHHLSETIVSKRGYSQKSEIFMLKTDMYSVNSKSLVWSAQTESVGPKSVDQVIIDVTDIIIDQLQSDDMLK